MCGNMYKVLLSKQSQKDLQKLISGGFSEKIKTLLAILAENPYQNPPEYEKLVGNLNKYYSRRINIQHRLVYEVDEEQKIVKILRMWTHYE